MPYRVIEITPSTDLEPLLRMLPSWRRELALKFRFPQGRLECALSYLLLQEILEADFGIKDQEPFTLSEHGKPSLACHPEIHFNLSHCKHAVACVVSSEGPVGIDVECRGRYSDSLAEYVLNDDELQLVRRSPDPDLEFTRLWTQKEAVLKQQGTGITDNLKEVLTSLNHKPLTLNFHDFVLSVAE